jgi:hypothetical protein
MLPVFFMLILFYFLLFVRDCADISLTAVGLLWNVADFLAHERDKAKASIYHMKDVASLPYLKGM